jgi:hypothetical protein
MGWGGEKEGGEEEGGGRRGVERRKGMQQFLSLVPLPYVLLIGSHQQGNEASSREGRQRASKQREATISSSQSYGLCSLCRRVRSRAEILVVGFSCSFCGCCRMRIRLAVGAARRRLPAQCVTRTGASASKVAAVVPRARVTKLGASSNGHHSRILCWVSMCLFCFVLFFIISSGSVWLYITPRSLKDVDSVRCFNF